MLDELNNLKSIITPDLKLEAYQRLIGRFLKTLSIFIVHVLYVEAQIIILI